MSTLTPPQANIPIGFVTVGGVRLPAAINPEWLRYLASSLFDRSGGTTGSGTGDLETAQYDDAGIDDLKAAVARVADELPMVAGLLAEIASLRERLDALEVRQLPDDISGRTWLQRETFVGGACVDRGNSVGNTEIAAATTQTVGRSLTLRSGIGGTGDAGSLNLIASHSSFGAPGAINVQPGYGNSTYTTGGALRLNGGNAASAVNAVGGDIEIKGGVGGNGGRGGHVLIQPGKGFGTVVHGNIQLDGGIGGSLSTVAVSGFVTYPMCAGTPTGAPLYLTAGSTPGVFDSTNLKDYRYVSGAWRFCDYGTRATKGVDTTDDLIIDLATKGVVLKDTAGTPHYWRVTINTSGALVTTDLGTTKP